MPGTLACAAAPECVSDLCDADLLFTRRSDDAIKHTSTAFISMRNHNSLIYPEEEQETISLLKDHI
jgi:hypothetical protein